jgi:hypothetical protein
MIVAADRSGRLGGKVVTRLRQPRLEVRIRRLAIGAAGALLLLALTSFVLLTLTGLPRTAYSSTLIAPRIVTSPEEPTAQPGGQR